MRLLVRELHHRVKNTLATVQAVLNASLRSSLGLSEFRQAFTGRIASLAKTHALITEDQTQVVPRSRSSSRPRFGPTTSPGSGGSPCRGPASRSRPSWRCRTAWRCTSLPRTRSATGRWPIRRGAWR
ncbi:HWE histidine kinase domain-containing protein [Methylorubrum extorquens]|uniref:HWE histidine kinase domain-containing protein n=1 Tax=Methylorubrum extorquens TaxID=408 RepID=UPI0024BA2272|nr:HWE histidine kinase domain-containing protein [Methylorubrum extorquens]